MNKMLTRRGFLSVALTFLCVVLGSAGEIPLDPNLIALFSDLHITAATPEQAKPEWAERVKRNVGCQWRVPLKTD